MFGRKKKRQRSAEVDTVIGSRVTIHGNLEFVGGVHIDGVVRGNIAAVDDDPGAIIIISEHAEVDGEVRVPNVVLNGSVVGDVVASERVELHQLARVSGNVHYSSMEMVMGAEVNGKLIRLNETALPAPRASSQNTPNTVEKKAELEEAPATAPVPAAAAPSAGVANAEVNPTPVASTTTSE